MKGCSWDPVMGMVWDEDGFYYRRQDVEAHLQQLRERIEQLKRELDSDWAEGYDKAIDDVLKVIGDK